jgi:hypothetical protein
MRQHAPTRKPSPATVFRWMTLFLLTAMALPDLAAAQPLKTLIDSQSYVFQPQSAQTLRGNVRYLTTDSYSLRIARDQIVSDLPYFGRACAAPTDPDESSLRFTIKEFTYTLKPAKKDGWTVTIEPKDKRSIQKLTIDITADGYATLQVTNTDRDPISFYGIIGPPAKR